MGFVVFVAFFLFIILIAKRDVKGNAKPKQRFTQGRTSSNNHVRGGVPFSPLGRNHSTDLEKSGLENAHSMSSADPMSDDLLASSNSNPISHSSFTDENMHEHLVNPASGLPMVEDGSGIDVAGNLYGHSGEPSHDGFLSTHSNINHDDFSHDKYMGIGNSHDPHDPFS